MSVCKTGLFLLYCLLSAAAVSQPGYYKAKAVERDGALHKLKVYAYDSGYHLQLRRQAAAWRIRGNPSGNIADLSGEGWNLQLGQQSVYVLPAPASLPSRYAWMLLTAGDTLMLEKPTRPEEPSGIRKAGLYRLYRFEGGQNLMPVQAYQAVLHLRQLRPGSLQLLIEPGEEPADCPPACQLAAAFVMLYSLHQEQKE
ncbi:MAG: hypothetical protein D6730_19095 [Bacteroidetes bacterium]|nr:MAG: hypothetical protein D6730_19095 [Bacteroidota bacterium]